MIHIAWYNRSWHGTELDILQMKTLIFVMPAEDAAFYFDF